MAKYLDPKVDFLFKKIFGENKELLISFLNSLLPLKDGQEILAIEYLSPEQLKDTPLGKNAIVDVRCIDNYERAFIVEMQSEWSSMFMKRLLANGAKAVVRQLDKKSTEDTAKKFQDIKPVYILAVINNKFSKSDNWYHLLQIREKGDSELIIKGLDYVLLELPNFTPSTWTYAHRKLAVLWLRFLKEIEGYYENLPEELTSNTLIHSAIKICEESALSPKEREAYERSKENAQWQESIKGLEDEVKKKKKTVAEKDQSLAEKDQSLAEKDQSLAEKDKRIAELERKLKEQLR
jgi:predicted transposase/invertase (TIGR01784 family)